MLFLSGLSLLDISVFLIVLVIAVTVHEFAHNYVAHLMGDRTPVMQGKLTLNPLAHVFWQGWVIFMLIGFAPLGFAQIDARQMRNPRWGYFAAVSAGPFSNLLLAIVFAIPAQLLFAPFDLFVSGANVTSIDGLVALFLRYAIQWNLILFMFNLLPLFPIDGWNMVYSILPPDLAYTWGRYQQQSQYVLFGVILLGFAIPQFSPLTFLVFSPANQLFFLLIGAV